MSIEIYVPPFPLSSYIECFWAVDLQVPYQREKILPSGRIELMINFGDPHRKYDQSGRRFDLMTKSWIAGFQTQYIVNEPVGHTDMIGVRFRPGGAAPFFAEPLQEFRNCVLEMDAIWGRSIGEIRERLLAISTTAGRFKLLEKIFLDRLLFGREPEGFVTYAIDCLIRDRGFSRIHLLSEEIGVSQKHLIQKFKEEIGVTPKQFARVLKLQTVLQQIDPRQLISWGEIASAALYYDQAHFNRDFRRFTGLTPADYIHYREKFFGPNLASGDNVHFVPVR
ncbi:MAG: helix-turn-helix domain-containing protein [Ardenticatenaceae bacterium]|nr:helix-turn-helix domain-containing protein [Ardenticatenaceae bacterium]